MLAQGWAGVYEFSLLRLEWEVKGTSSAYSEEEIASLELTLSSDRLRSYLFHSNGDRVAAIHLYEHNCDLSEALYGVLQGLRK